MLETQEAREMKYHAAERRYTMTDREALLSKMTTCKGNRSHGPRVGEHCPGNQSYEEGLTKKVTLD